jgi:hypothetical protein
MKLKNIIEKIKCRCRVSCCLTNVNDDHIEIHLDSIKELEGNLLTYKIGSKTITISFI